MRKWIILFVCSVCLTACSWQGVKDYFVGKKITDAQGVVTYEPAPIDDWIPLLGTLVPGLGIAAAAATRIARNAVKTRDALLDTNEEAIKDADWKKIDSAKSFKALLRTAQKIHPDTEILRKQYVNWKKKKIK